MPWRSAATEAASATGRRRASVARTRFRQPALSRRPGADARVTFLLVGVDSGIGREQELTDTMLVVSVDPDGTSAMISVPRDLYGVPLPGGGTYDAKLNSMLSYADTHPDEYPLGGADTLKATIGELLGIKIHYFAAINLTGFKQAIDAIGGVDITVERAIADPVYSEDGIEGPGLLSRCGALPHGRKAGPRLRPIAAWPGRQRLHAGRTATGGARRGAAEADGRQPADVALPSLLDAVRNSIATDVPASRIPALAEAIQAADMSRLERAVIEPPLVTAVEDPVEGYILDPDLDAIQSLMRQLLGESLGGSHVASADRSPSSRSPTRQAKP